MFSLQPPTKFVNSFFKNFIKNLFFFCIGHYISNILKWDTFEKVLHFLTLCDTHKAVETCGFASEDVFCRVLEKTDYVMLDIKLADSEVHKKYTGVGNELILKNLDNLRQSGKSFILRTPLIEGITDTKENLDAIREIVKDDPWETLPFNPLTESKYERIGRKFDPNPVLSDTHPCCGTGSGRIPCRFSPQNPR